MNEGILTEWLSDIYMINCLDAARPFTKGGRVKIVKGVF